MTCAEDALSTPARPTVMRATVKRRSGAHKSKQATKDRTGRMASRQDGEPGANRVAGNPGADLLYPLEAIKQWQAGG